MMIAEIGSQIASKEKLLKKFLLGNPLQNFSRAAIPEVNRIAPTDDV